MSWTRDGDGGSEVEFECTEVTIEPSGPFAETTKIGKPASRELVGDDLTMSLKADMKKGQNLTATGVQMFLGEKGTAKVYPDRSDADKKWVIPAIVTKENNMIKAGELWKLDVELKLHGDTGGYTRPAAT